MKGERQEIVKMFTAYVNLQGMGWRQENLPYRPKDGTVYELIEAGSTGVHEGHYKGEWPNGSWWVHVAGDTLPSRPILFRPKEEQS